MSKILTQVKTTTTCWAIPNIASLEEVEVKSLLDLSINEVSFCGTVLSAVCTSVEDTRTYTLSDEEDKPVPFFEPADDEVFRCIKSLIDMTSPTLQTFKELEELQHWIENKKRDISLKN